MRPWPRLREDKTRQRWVVDCGKVGGHRQQYYRASKAEAESLAAEKRQERERFGALAFGLTAEQRIDAAQACEILGAVSLTEAAKFWRHEHQQRTTETTVAALCAALLQQAERRGLRLASRVSMRSWFRRFAGAFGDRPVRSITAQEIETWLDSLADVGDTTRNNALRYLSIVFNRAQRDGLVDRAATAGVARRKIAYRLPEHMPAASVRAALEYAEDHDPDLVCRLAIGFFAGLRSAELDKLNWKDINVEARTIRVSPDAAKTGIPRVVEIADNLAAWLRPRQQIAGPVCVTQRSFLARRRAQGEAWPHNAMRHTFATFHLALHEDAAKTSLQLGHQGNSRLLYRHYRGLATRTEAAEFWALRPAENKVEIVVDAKAS